MINTSYARFSQLKPRFAANPSQPDVSEQPLRTREEERADFFQALRGGASLDELLKRGTRVAFAPKDPPSATEQPLGTFDEEAEALFDAIKRGAPITELFGLLVRLACAPKPPTPHRPATTEPMILPPGFKP